MWVVVVAAAATTAVKNSLSRRRKAGEGYRSLQQLSQRPQFREDRYNHSLLLVLILYLWRVPYLMSLVVQIVRVLFLFRILSPPILSNAAGPVWPDRYLPLAYTRAQPEKVEINKCIGWYDGDGSSGDANNK